MSKVNDLADMLEEVARDPEAFDYYSGAVAQTLKILGMYDLYVKACIVLLDNLGVANDFADYAYSNDISKIDADVISEAFDDGVLGSRTEHLIGLLEDKKVEDAFIDFVNKNI